jgi:hypothetical protein
MTEFTAKSMLERVQSISQRLKDAGIWHEVRAYRQDGLSIVARVPQAYWEIDVLDDGSVDVEEFRSNGLSGSSDQIDRLIASQA